MLDPGGQAGVEFGIFETILTKANDISLDRRPAFVSRLKQWQKMGFPDIQKVGRGQRARYSLEHLFQVSILIDLLKLGLTPERAIAIIQDHWSGFRLGINQVVDNLANKRATPIMAAIHPENFIDIAIPFSGSGRAGVIVHPIRDLMALGWDRERDGPYPPWFADLDAHRHVSVEVTLLRMKEFYSGAMLINLTLKTERVVSAIKVQVAAGLVHFMADWIAMKADARADAEAQEQRYRTEANKLASDASAMEREEEEQQAWLDDAAAMTADVTSEIDRLFELEQENVSKKA